MERIVIAAYKPFPGKEAELDRLMKTHWDILNHEGLVSQRKSIIAKAEDGTIIEVFGWKSEYAMQQAHNNPAVQRLWANYAQVCQYIPVAEISESKRLFSAFTPMN